MKRAMSRLVAFLWGRRPEPEDPRLFEMQRQYERAMAFEQAARIGLVVIDESTHEALGRGELIDATGFDPEFIADLRNDVAERKLRAMG